jgi:hypothetical protein
MKKYYLTTLISLATVVCIDLSNSAVAQEVPLLKQFTPYSEVRQILLDAGWQAKILSWNQRESPPTEIEQDFIETLGYDELVSCSGTGLGLCRFEFSNIDRQTLVLITANNQVSPALYEWWLE